MHIVPEISNYQKEELRKLNPHLEAKWNRQYEYWEIWFDDKLKKPYVILRTLAINSRTREQIRYALWISQHLNYHIGKGYQQSQYIWDKKLGDEEDLYKEMGKETAPLMKSLVDAGSSSHGNSVNMFPGFGEGKK